MIFTRLVEVTRVATLSTFENALLLIWFLTFAIVTIAVLIRVLRQIKYDQVDKHTFWMIIAIFLYGLLPFFVYDFILA